MSIYIKEDGRRILSLSDEDLKDLGWIEENLLELEHDGVGWTIQEASCYTKKVIKNESKTGPLRRPMAT